VIANPPYIQLQKAKGKYADRYKNLGYTTFNRMGDIYCLFYEKGIKILRNNGILTFITSNKWMRAGYGDSLREFFLKYNPKILIDLGPNVFESATVDTNILIIQKAENQNQLKAVTIEDNKKDNLDISEKLQENGVTLTNLSKDTWFIGNSAEQQLKEKIERIGKPLKEWDVKIYRGILTGLNEAFIITNGKRKEILDNCKTDEEDDERKRTEEIIKPILRGRDIKRYYYDWDDSDDWAGSWVIIIPAGWTNKNRGKQNAEEFIYEQFPSLMNHLKRFEAKAKKRDDQGDYWWELRACSYYPEFEKEKVVWAQTDQALNTVIVPKGIYLQQTCLMIISKHPIFLNFMLNSKVIQWFIRLISPNLGKKGLSLTKESVEKMPLPPITPQNENIVKQIESLVDKILKAKKQDKNANTVEWEQEIDKLVYLLYELTDQEIKIIEEVK
jgi:lambda repressor-like predicted transcriptional regulator